MARANSMMCPASTGNRLIPMVSSDPCPSRAFDGPPDHSCQQPGDRQTAARRRREPVSPGAIPPHSVVVVDPALLNRRRTAGTGASGLHVEMLGRFVVRIDGRDVTDALAGRS